ncbi:MAG: Ldh family oxidoreductase [Rhizobiaceae bacterium]
MSGKMQLAEIGEMAANALRGAGARDQNAASVARSTVLAERDGIRSHGLLYVPIYAEHVRCGKVDGEAVPVVSRSAPGVVRVDARNGFAHPAIDAGFELACAAARENGIASLTLHNSYNCGVLGHHAERFAEVGLVGLCFTHAPASIAPVGGRKPVIGTNPFALGVPDGKGGAAFVIDQSASAIAKSEIMLRARMGEPIEPGWAIDCEGRPTTDAQEALKGAMLPAGGYKGFGIGLTVEVLASCLAGALLSKDAGAFSGTAGGPPSSGQCFIAIDPQAHSGAYFHAQIERLCQLIEEQDGARLPGSRRAANRVRIEREGVAVDDDLKARILAYCES